MWNRLLTRLMVYWNSLKLRKKENFNQICYSNVTISVLLFLCLFTTFILYLSSYLSIIVFEQNADNFSSRPFHPLPPEFSKGRNIDQNSHDLMVRRHAVGLSSHKTEAMSCMNVAEEMKKAGKYEKAMKIIYHGYTLAPNDPDILNAYGEFLEDVEKDVIAADEKYCLALAKNPTHEKALINRQRTSSLVEELDSVVLKQIDEKRNKVSAIPESNLALCRAKREAYFQHIYHTVGIEGNTMTLSQTRSIVETRLAIGGKSIAEHNEILGLDSALKYINSTLIDRVGQITVEDILEIHRRVLGYVDPTESGIFRNTQVFVGGHIPPSPQHIPFLMEEFVTWLNSEKAVRLHPVQLAALVHYKFVYIHPFLDGNGRTSRLLMNMILMRAGFPPVIIPKQERHRYYQLLELANQGDIRPFVRFIAECTDRTLDLFLWATTDYEMENIPALDFDNLF